VHARRRTIATFPAGFVGLLAVAGYMIGPDFTAPPAPLAEHWLEAGDAALDTTRQEYRDWWSVFGDATLARLVEIAYAQNLMRSGPASGSSGRAPSWAWPWASSTRSSNR
jgi:hypothetical protein